MNTMLFVLLLTVFKAQRKNTSYTQNYAALKMCMNCCTGSEKGASRVMDVNGVTTKLTRCFL